MMPPVLHLYYCCNPVCLKRKSKTLWSVRNISMLVFFMMTGWILTLTPKECSTTPLKASKIRRAAPLVERRMSLPSLLNLIPVHSQVRSYWSLKVAKGPCRQVRSDSLTCNQTSHLLAPWDCSRTVHKIKGLNCKRGSLDLQHPSYLVEGPQIIKFHHFWIYSSSKNETFWVKGTHRLPLKVH